MTTFEIKCDNKAGLPVGGVGRVFIGDDGKAQTVTIVADKRDFQLNAAMYKEIIESVSLYKPAP